MNIRSITQKNHYENFSNDSLSANQDSRKNKTELQEQDVQIQQEQQDKTEITQDILDQLESSGELSNIAQTVNEKVVNALKSRLQSAESQLKKLDLQMRNLSTNASSQYARGIFATQTLSGGVSGSGVAATLADMEKGEMAQQNGTGKSDKVATKEAMMKYLSVEKSIKMAEIMNIQREIARAQGFN